MGSLLDSAIQAMDSAGHAMMEGLDDSPILFFTLAFGVPLTAWAVFLLTGLGWPVSQLFPVLFLLLLFTVIWPFFAGPFTSRLMRR